MVPSCKRENGKVFFSLNGAHFQEFAKLRNNEKKKKLILNISSTFIFPKKNRDL